MSLLFAERAVSLGFLWAELQGVVLETHGAVSLVFDPLESDGRLQREQVLAFEQ